MSFTSHQVVTDLALNFSQTIPPVPPSSESNLGTWRRIEKELYLHKYQQRAWLYIKLANEEDLTNEDLVVTGIMVSGLPPTPDYHWESRPGGIWVRKSKFSGAVDRIVTEVDVLFGVDAVDPRPQHALMEIPLQLKAPLALPVARLSVRYGRAKPRPDQPVLRVRVDGKFKILLISDTHMRTGVGICTDAIDVDGNYLPQGEADPLTVRLIRKILDIEKPDLVVLTGDQVHHDICDTQTALFKVVTPIIEREIPWVAVFGNHDSEGTLALSRTQQMSIYQNLPYSLCDSGPEEVDGVGNFYLQVFPLASSPTQLPLLTLYFLDSHGQIQSNFRPDYDPIKQSQIEWFTKTSQALQRTREEVDNTNSPHLAMAVQHIPVTEFGYRDLRIYKGHRGEPTEGPRSNSGFYQALVKEHVSGLFCGHDHVNTFCALLPRQIQQGDGQGLYLGPWLCYTGCAGFGGYCSYGKKRFHRGARAVELDPRAGSLKTWRRVEFVPHRVDEIVLVDNGALVEPLGEDNKGFTVS